MRELEMDNGRVTERRTDLLECEDCGDRVTRLQADRTTDPPRWLCEDCHPDWTDEFAPEREEA